MKKALIAIAAILFLHTTAVAVPDCYSNCFEIVAGEYPTLVFTENRDVQIKIEAFAADAHGWWTVSDASVTGNIVFAFCEVGSRVATANFGNAGNHISRDFSPREEPIFRFAFRWENRVPSGPSGYYIGWVSLIVNAANEPVVYGSEVSIHTGEPVMGRGEPAHLYAEVTFRTIDHGDWLEIAPGSTPKYTERWIQIPSEIDGKPVRMIGEMAFAGWQNTKGFVIPDGVEGIEYAAFSDCTSITELEIPSSVTNVAMSIIAGCSALRDVRINAALPTFGDMAFSHSGVTNVVLASGITNIDNCAFADSPNLVSVTIPQSVKRICARSFYENCPSLTSVSVPYATIIEDEAFPPGCTVTRYGPNIDVYISAPWWKKVDEETKIALMRTLDLQDYESAETLNFEEWHDPDSPDDEPVTASVACAHLGISPMKIETWDNDGRHKGVFNRMPSVVMTGFDPVARTITGRVVPAAGTRIVSEPLKRAFGFKQYLMYPKSDGGMIEGNDWGPWINAGDQGFDVDFADYLTDGTFRITYPDYVNQDKCPNIFRILLHDNAEQYW